MTTKNMDQSGCIKGNVEKIGRKGEENWKKRGQKE
jgi:hypothetical protein